MPEIPQVRTGCRPHAAPHPTAAQTRQLTRAAEHARQRRSPDNTLCREHYLSKFADDCEMHAQRPDKKLGGFPFETPPCKTSRIEKTGRPLFVVAALYPMNRDDDGGRAEPPLVPSSFQRKPSMDHLGEVIKT